MSAQNRLPGRAVDAQTVQPSDFQDISIVHHADKPSPHSSRVSGRSRRGCGAGAPQPRAWLLGLAALAALALAGCGFGGRPLSQTVAVRVTTGFGSTVVGDDSLSRFPAAWSVLALTRHFFAVQTASGGRSVTSIKRIAGQSTRQWSLYINGIAAAKGAGATRLYPGDQVWWDLHDRRVTANVPAVVGAFPEPFTSGSGGQRIPTALICANQDEACAAVTRSLDRAGVKVAFQGLGTGSGAESLSVVVGTYRQLRGVIATELLSAGPSQSGVYATFVGSSGQALELEDPTGNVVDTVHGSVGLIAAVEESGINEPVWLVTGNDRAGVAAAAQALTPAALADHFAVAVLPDHRVIGLPLDPNR